MKNPEEHHKWGLHRISLQQKLLISTVSLIVFSFLSIFSAVHYYVEDDIVRKVDEHLMNISDDLIKSYNLGYQFQIDSYKNGTEGLPKMALSHLDKELKNLEVTHWKKIIKDDVPLYELKGFRDGVLYEIEVDLSGNIIEVEVEPTETKFSVVMRTFKARVSSKEPYWVNIISRKQPQDILGDDVDLSPSSDYFYNEGQSYTHLLKDSSEVRVLDRELSNDYFLRVGCYLNREESFMMSYRKAFVAVFIPIFMISILVILLNIRRINKEMKHLKDGMQLMARGKLDSRIVQVFKIEDFHELSLKFNEMALRVQQMMSEMQTMTDQVAHDLRTPIARIRTQIEVSLLNEHDLDEVSNEMIGSILEECQTLETLVSMMLEISELDSKYKSIQLIEVDLCNLINQSVSLYGLLFEDRSIVFRAEVPDQKLIVLGNKHMLQRAVSNLLDNALKFTEKGEVSIKLYTADNLIILEVGDTGMGISERDILNVFKRFYRSERSLAFAGNGLGLSYVDAVVRAHQGQIEVSSVIEKGSVFKIKLPLVLKSV